MTRHRPILTFIRPLPLALWLALAGCTPTHQQQASALNAQVHRSGDSAAYNTDQMLAAVGNARTWLAALIQKVDAHLADPAHNPAPTPQETRQLAQSADGELAKGQRAGEAVKADVKDTVAAADAQKSASDKAVADATNEQRRKDERAGGILMGVLLGFVTFLAIERFTHFTFLPALIPAIGVGILTFVLFGQVADAIRGVIDDVLKPAIYGAMLLGVGVLAFYVRRRLATGGGLKGLFRNVELTGKTVAA